MVTEISEREQKSPVLGEATKKQAAGVYASFIDVFGVSSGTFDTYRKMRTNPTVALARVVATAPIKTSNYSIKSEDDVSEDMIGFIQKQIDELWPLLIENILYSLDYGFQSFEKVWDVRMVDGSPRYVLRKLKPLVPDQIKVVLDKKYGNFAGLRQNEIHLLPNKCFHYIYDGEAGNYYGRSRHENIREHAWMPWVDIAKKQKQYAGKIAGVIPLIKYPIGKSMDATGTETSNYEIAKAILSSLGTGKGVAMPQEIVAWARDLARQGVDPEAFAAWHISFLETKGQHATGFVNTLRHYESLILRGWIVPERAAIEGQFGTKAEAGEHGDLTLTMADLVFQDIIRCVNWYIVNPLLVYNFGPDSENKVWLERAGLDPALAAFFRSIVEKVLAAPSNVDLFQTWLDVDAMLDQVGLPKGQEQINTEGVIPQKQDDGEIPQGDQLKKIKEVYASIGKG